MPANRIEMNAYDCANVVLRIERTKRAAAKEAKDK